MIGDIEGLRKAIEILIGSVENLFQENEELKKENRQLCGENARLKGGNACPEIKGKKRGIPIYPAGVRRKAIQESRKGGGKTAA